MSLTLHHFFILTEPGGTAGEVLINLGLKESFSRDHPGQGTSNRRFELANSMLELLWVRDEEEAIAGPGRDLKLTDRIGYTNASPFGIILGCGENSLSQPPFTGWSYQPEYFEPPMAFHVGENADNILEPLCIYAPFMQPIAVEESKCTLRSLSHINITTTVDPLSNVLNAVSSAEKLSIESGDEHLLEVYLDTDKSCRTEDLRPDLPLIIYH
ncbi:MAG: hypothetical protein KTR18_13930 [Acidiferrobacterales bacterium]|nr:hypothetical protein [Acidiferrobacterales bacterium]